ncbi:unnamed protein product [Angiostrongylus costaricensis]|uniref:BHLH domain-containing protein n=1 Tax=Angiostrongylus costaricensis TaxID=334426 RepID=A0A0R3PFM9_ANGCS|nr:unnamed protein product [Angiostrongylus costaricensis]
MYIVRYTYTHIYTCIHSCVYLCTYTYVYIYIYVIYILVLLFYEKPVTFYKFGPKKTQSIAIDVSLNKLNKCIKVAYNKMTTPKWKDFKGLRLHWKQRIRLNNVIWRAYYIEFRRPTKKAKKKTPFCYFTVPDDDTTHAKIEGSLLEGMHWKRRIEAVCTQNKRWRHYMKKNKGSSWHSERFDRDLYERPSKQVKSQIPETTSTDYNDFDDLENVFTDSLFESLNQPYMFPYPKEFVQSGNADIMQPGLLSLQPSLEEIMASLGKCGTATSVFTFLMLSSFHFPDAFWFSLFVYTALSFAERLPNDSHISLIRIFTLPQITMGCQPSTPARPWWLDSPLSATAQSPLTAVAPSINGGNVTSLGPSTPLGIGTGMFFAVVWFSHNQKISFIFFSLLPHCSVRVSLQLSESYDKSEPKEEPVLMSAPSSVKSGRGCSPDSTLHPEERKRILHLHAEQNRRSALKDGFDMLMDMIPDLHSGGVKPTNAVVLAKGAEYIRHLTALKNEQSSQKVALMEKIVKLNQRIEALQSNLPSSSGVSSTKLEPRAALEAFYDRYTKESSRKDYRFWVVCFVCSNY